MATYTTIDPVTRLEGHLRVDVTIDMVNNQQQVVDAHATGTLFRGFEQMLANRDPWDAPHLTQRVCGVCPTPHGMAAVMALDRAANKSVPANGRILRNFVLGANFVQSHILHFYHLAALDYMAGPAMAPWTPGWEVDRRLDTATTNALIEHYKTALKMMRQAQEMGAIFGGRLPHSPAYIPGGFTEVPTSTQINQARAYADLLIPFIRDVYIPDVNLLFSVYSDYASVGRGYGNLVAFGVFDLDSAGQSKLLRSGLAANGTQTVQTLNVASITEQVTNSWYDDTTNNLNPMSGVTKPVYPKDTKAYSWLKAPRYNGQPYEAGPLARMWVNGDYRSGISVMDRHKARAQEALKVANAMKTWLSQIVVGQPVYSTYTTPSTASGIGLTEAPRGALGHWVRIASGKIANYQMITPTCWNASPRDTANQLGPMEKALIGTPIRDAAKPIEVVRVIHSFDPCLSCAVHAVRPGGKESVTVIPM
jgi:hydrogenase large subunit